MYVRVWVCGCICMVGGTFCKMPLQSREMARLASRQNARLWMWLWLLPESGAAWQASFITLCIRELVSGPRGNTAA